LFAIAKSRNWVLKADSYDTERTAKYILKDFRDGRLGKFILDEFPNVEE
jgi:ribosome biogenesis GTPase A